MQLPDKLKEYSHDAYCGTGLYYFAVDQINCVLKSDLKEEAIRIFKNLQGPDTIYPLILNNFPDSSKGEIAKDKWNDTDFRYGTEYGMLAMLFWLVNLTEEDLKNG